MFRRKGSHETNGLDRSHRPAGLQRRQRNFCGRCERSSRADRNGHLFCPDRAFSLSTAAAAAAGATDTAATGATDATTAACEGLRPVTAIHIGEVRLAVTRHLARMAVAGGIARMPLRSFILGDLLPPALVFRIAPLAGSSLVFCALIAIGPLAVPPIVGAFVVGAFVVRVA